MIKFSLGGFIKDQINAAKTVFKSTLAPANLLERVTPRQVKQILGANPINAINGSLGKLASINLGQLVSSAGQYLKSQITSLVQGTIRQLEAQIAGCINKAIRDILNKNPIIEKILFFDQFINAELGKLKNKLESKIDNALRKLAYDKINIHQRVRFKQKIASAIKKICPDATPASPSQVRQYKDLFKKAKTSITEGLQQDEPLGDTIPANLVNNSTLPPISTVEDTNKGLIQWEDNSISNTVKRQLKTDPDKLEEIKQEITKQALKDIEEEALKQNIPETDQTPVPWDDLYNVSEPPILQPDYNEVEPESVFEAPKDLKIEVINDEVVITGGRSVKDILNDPNIPELPSR